MTFFGTLLTRADLPALIVYLKDCFFSKEFHRSGDETDVERIRLRETEDEMSTLTTWMATAERKGLNNEAQTSVLHLEKKEQGDQTQCRLTPQEPCSDSRERGTA